MALNFPNSPTNGQLYTDTMSGNSWTWDSANTCWKSTSTYIQTITVASSAPGTPAVGQLWWNQDYGRLLVYYSDGTSSQWVDASPSDYTSGLAYNQANAAFGVANAVFNQSNTVYGVANAGFGKANTALQNTSGTFAGSLTTTGNITIPNNTSVSPVSGYKILLAGSDSNHFIGSSGSSGNQMFFGEYGRWNFYDTSSSSTVAYIDTSILSLSSLQGIRFQATQSASADANTLDDYEEGTWTPRLNFGGVDHDGSYSYQSAYYCKIGSLLHLSGIVGLLTAGTTSGQARLSNLPFSVAATVGSGFSQFYGSMSSMGYGIAADVGGPQMTLYTPTAVGLNSLTKANFTVAAGNYIQFNITVRTA